MLLKTRCRNAACAIVLCVMSAISGAQEAGAGRARIDYLLHCSGCHGQDGIGNPEKGIPHFAGQIGHFLRLPEGREFILQVPGLLSAGMPDERAARVVNWMLQQFAGASLPENFAPLTTEEAKLARETRPADIMARRNAIYQRLLSQGYIIQ